MKRTISIAAAVFAALALGSAASATTFVFKGKLNLYDDPTNTSNIAGPADMLETGPDYCTAQDYCTKDNSEGFTYSKDGVEFTAYALQGGGYLDGSNNNWEFATLIQDLRPGESGLGVLSDGDTTSDDQVQLDPNGESIYFGSANEMTIANIEFNNGADTDCGDGTPDYGEGPCGEFDLYIDNALFGHYTATDLLALAFTGHSFEFVSTTAGGGFAIAKFDAYVPVPGALPLLLSGLAGLGFASRRKKVAA